MEIVKFASLPVFAYLLGSIPWGLVLTRKFSSVDIRQEGSKNIGAANVKRVAGLQLGVLTLAADLLKGVLPVFLAGIMTAPDDFRSELFLSFVAFSAFSGHLYPVFMKFKNGGKGVATAAGCFLVLSPIACGAAILIYILVVCLFNRSSLGSLVASATLPLAVLAVSRSGIMTGCAGVMVILIYYRHKDNIRRLLSGTEPVLWDKNK